MYFIIRFFKFFSMISISNFTKLYILREHAKIEIFETTSYLISRHYEADSNKCLECGKL